MLFLLEHVELRFQHRNLQGRKITDKGHVLIKPS